MKSFKMNRQGVRDLNVIRAPKREKIELPPNCDHVRMRNSGGHVSCQDCGLEWDSYSNR